MKTLLLFAIATAVILAFFRRRELLCRFGIHLPPPGVSASWSISFHCERCHDVVRGELADRRRRG